MKYVSLLIETTQTTEVFKRKIVSVSLMEAADEEEAVKKFEFENMAAGSFEHPRGRDVNWILEADYGDGTVIQLYPVTYVQDFHG